MAEAGQTAILLSEMTESLPESLKIPLVLKYSDGLSENDIADILDLSKNAVKIRISRARARLWDAYHKADKDLETK